MPFGRLDQTFDIHEFHRPEKATIKLSLPRRFGLRSDFPSDSTHVAYNDTTSIVAVHGLNGDAIQTWTSNDGKTCWLKELLPAYLETATIVSWGYNANVSSFKDREMSREDISGHAQTLVSQLHAYRAVRMVSWNIGMGHSADRKKLEGINDCPIIFVCHSLGGIIVKRVSVSDNSAGGICGLPFLIVHF